MLILRLDFKPSCETSEQTNADALLWHRAPPLSLCEVVTIALNQCCSCTGREGGVSGYVHLVLMCQAFSARSLSVGRIWMRRIGQCWCGTSHPERLAILSLYCTKENTVRVCVCVCVCVCFGQPEDKFSLSLFNDRATATLKMVFHRAVKVAPMTGT